MRSNTYIFLIEDELKAQRIHAFEDDEATGKGWKHRFVSDYQWIGKLGQWGFHLLYPEFIDNTQDLVADDFDFLHPYTTEKIELKTSRGNLPYASNMLVVVNAIQMREKAYPILVFAYYDVPNKKLTIRGWQYRETLTEKGNYRFYKKGEMVLTNWGTPCFPARGDLFVFDQDLLIPIDSLLTITL